MTTVAEHFMAEKAFYEAQSVKFTKLKDEIAELASSVAKIYRKEKSVVSTRKWEEYTHPDVFWKITPEGLRIVFQTSFLLDEDDRPLRHSVIFPLAILDAAEAKDQDTMTEMVLAILEDERKDILLRQEIQKKKAEEYAAQMEKSTAEAERAEYERLRAKFEGK